MKRPLRVLQLRDSPWVDGPGRTILETACRIDPANVEFHIGALVSRNSTSHPLLDSAKARGAHAHAIVDGGGLTNELLSRIEELIRSLRVDVLHTSEFRSNVLGMLVARRCGVRLVTTVHGWIANDLRGRFYRVADKALLRYFDAVICVSQATRSLVPSWWLPSRKVHVLYNGLSQPPAPIPVPPSRGVWEQFLAVRSGRIPNPSPPEIGLRMAKLWDAIRASAANYGLPVRCEYL